MSRNNMNIDIIAVTSSIDQLSKIGNISAKVSKKFMEAVENNTDYVFRIPVDIFKRIILINLITYLCYIH